MFTNISYFLIFGKPLIMYLGILTYSSFIFTALIGYTHFKGRPILPFKWHIRFALTSIILATIHGFLGIAAYFK